MFHRNCLLVLFGLLLLVSAGVPTAYAAATWVPVGTAGFSGGAANFTSLALDGSTPYLAYRDAGNSNKATVMKFDGTNWVNVGLAGFSAGAVQYTSLVLDGSTPYVAYRDAGNSSKATVMKFDGSNWVNVGLAGFSGGAVQYISLVLDGSTPYVAFQDGSNSGKATVMKFDGTNWINVGNAGFSGGAVQYTSLALDGSTPYVAYQGVDDNNRASVMKFDGTDWVIVGSAGFSGGAVQYTSLALDGSTPYVAYQDADNGDKPTVLQFDGTDWIPVGNVAFSAGVVDYLSLALDGSTLYLAYQDEGNSNQATVMKSDGGNWVNVGSAGFSAGAVQYTSLALDGSTPYVAYRDAGNSGKATVMKFVDPQSGPSFVVNDGADTDDGSCDTAPLDCTLREAINAANALSGADTVTFDIPASDSGCTAANVCTITLGATLPVLQDDVTIDGAPNAGSITVSGNNSVQVLGMDFVTANINALTIANGNCSGCDGGGMFTFGTTTVTNSTFLNNVSGEAGGGIYNSGGVLTISNSTFYNNSATERGGGISNGAAGLLNVYNTTVSNSSAPVGTGGGVSSDTGFLTLYNTIVTNSLSGGDCGGPVTADASNLDNDGTCDNATSATALELALGGLGSNGGPTQTIALGYKSVAIDAGDATVCADTLTVNGLDQRGNARNDLRCDVGAFEFVLSDGDTVAKSNLSFGPLYTFGPTVAGVTSGNTYNGTLTIQRVPTAPTAGTPPANPLPITWEATTTTSSFSFLFTLCYNPSVLTGQDESTLHVYHYNGSTWDDLGGSLDTVTHFPPYHCVSATTAITSLSPLALAPGHTTAVNVSAVKGNIGKKGAVQLKWHTFSESFISGFNVYRKVGKGAWKKFNVDFLSAKHPGDPSGAKYKFKDGKVKAGKKYRYKIEIVYTDNHSEWSNVVKVKIP